MLSGATESISKMEINHVTSTHTPSVIGTQEVYRLVFKRINELWNKTDFAWPL